MSISQTEMNSYDKRVTAKEYAEIKPRISAGE